MSSATPGQRATVAEMILVAATANTEKGDQNAAALRAVLRDSEELERVLDGLESLYLDLALIGDEKAMQVAEAIAVPLKRNGRLATAREKKGATTDA